MLKKPATTNKIRLDPMFVIPAGAEDLFVYTKAQDDVTQFDVEDITFDVDDSVTDADSTFLGVPDNFSILSQTVRRSSGGQLVIDVVIEIDDVPGATDYDVQVVGT